MPVEILLHIAQQSVKKIFTSLYTYVESEGFGDDCFPTVNKWVFSEL